MLQHMLLMMVAPPLILLGAPLIPIVRGLPRFAAREFAGPFLNWPLANRIGTALTNPVCALVLMGVVMFAWHTPKLYELALGSSSWHEVEHACFFLASIIFWWPVVQPWPSRAQWPRWAMVPYLFVADLQNTILSAILVFSDHVLYPSYAATPRLFGLSAQADQAAAGAIMWVLGGFAYVFPAVVIAIHCLSKRSARSRVAPVRSTNDSLVDEPSSFRSKLHVIRRFPAPTNAEAERRRWFGLWFCSSRPECAFRFCSPVHPTMTIRLYGCGNKADRSALRSLRRPAIFKPVPQASAFWSRIETRKRYCSTRRLSSRRGRLLQMGAQPRRFAQAARIRE